MATIRRDAFKKRGGDERNRYSQCDGFIITILPTVGKTRRITLKLSVIIYDDDNVMYVAVTSKRQNFL